MSLGGSRFFNLGVDHFFLSFAVLLSLILVFLLFAF
jgi:hypothetical protein